MSCNKNLYTRLDCGRNITFILFQMLKIPDSLTIEYFLNDLGLGLQKGFQHSTQIVLFKQEYDFLNEGLKIEDFR